MPNGSEISSRTTGPSILAMNDYFNPCTLKMLTLIYTEVAVRITSDRGQVVPL